MPSMRATIDNDIRLFLPNEYEYVLYGGNFLFTKRFYEIAKRTESIKRIDYKGRLDSINKIHNLIEHYSSKTFIFSSELVETFNSSELDSFLILLENKTIKFIFINIGEETIFKNKIISKLNINKDLIFSFNNFLTYVISNIQENPIFNKEINISKDTHLADDLIDELLIKLKLTGFIPASKSLKNSKEVFDYVTVQSKAALNLVYRKKPYEIVNGKSIAEWRMLLGYTLSTSIDKEIIDEIDIILPVPETGKTYAQGIASSISKPYVEALYKKAEVGRSFDIQDKEIRKKFIKTKLGLINTLVKDKVVGVVDEAIFTGMTLKEVCLLLEEAEVKKIYLLIPTPECTTKCSYNLQPTREFLSGKYSNEQLKEYFRVKDILFQDYTTFKNIMEDSGFNYLCCFENG